MMAAYLFLSIFVRMESQRLWWVRPNGLGAGVRIVAIWSAALLTACATELPTIKEHWHRASTTEQQFGADYYACMKDAQQQRSEGMIYQGTGSARSHTIIDRRMFEMCMGARGYRQTADGHAPHRLARPAGFGPVEMR